MLQELARPDTRRAYAALMTVRGETLAFDCKPERTWFAEYYVVTCVQRPDLRLILRTAHNFEAKALEALVK
jgi:hypothetical protein